MFRQLINECRIAVTIRPIDPILVKSGGATITGPDMSFVQTYRDGELVPYLPGSSLKGVVRSHAERIAQTLGVLVCDPLCNKNPALGRQEACSHRLKKRPSVPKTHADQCPICRLFGSLAWAGRCSLSDAYPIEPGRSERRDGVGIDRITGGASASAKFDLEVQVGGAYETEVIVQNFELWQLGLLAFVLQDLAEGFIRLGSGRSRGLGRVRGQVTGLDLHYFGRFAPPPGIVAGIGWALKADGQAYDLATPKHDMVMVADMPEPQSNGLRTTSRWTGPGVAALLHAVAPVWLAFAESRRAGAARG